MSTAVSGEGRQSNGFRAGTQAPYISCDETLMALHGPWATGAMRDGQVVCAGRASTSSAKAICGSAKKPLWDLQLARIRQGRAVPLRAAGGAAVDCGGLRGAYGMLIDPTRARADLVRECRSGEEKTQSATRSPQRSHQSR